MVFISEVKCRFKPGWHWVFKRVPRFFIYTSTFNVNSSKISNLQLLHSFCYSIRLFSTFRFSFTTHMITCRFNCLKVVLYTDSRLEMPLQMGSLRERFATHDAAKLFHPATLVPYVTLQRAGILVVFIAFPPRALIPAIGV